MSITFRYFAQPHAFSNYTIQPAPCGFCGELRPYYAGPFFGPDDDRERICEECVANGRLEAADLTLNEGDIAALRTQLAERRPDLAQEDIERMAHERSAEVNARTPAPQTWQDLFWPAHCGDYCRYLKEVGQPEIFALAPDGDGPAYLLAHADGVDDIEHARDVWEGVRPDAPRDASLAYSQGVYLFECLTCGEHLMTWDCD